MRSCGMSVSVNVFEGVVLVAVEGDLVAGPVFLAAPPGR